MIPTLAPAWSMPSPLAAPVVPNVAKTDPARMLAAARDFEAMAIGALLAPMFETVDLSKGPFGGGAGEAAWKPMLIEEMSKKISQHGGLGLARSIHDAMLRMQEDKQS